MRRRYRRAAAVAALGLAVTAAGGETRFSAGAFHFRWRTEGPHGHLADCRTAACDREDLARGNLDNALGLRLGAERTAWRRGRLELDLGLELGLLFTERNLSQRDLTFLEAAGTAAGAVRLGGSRLLLRAGAGGVVREDGGGWGRFVEAGAELPLGGGASLRPAVRRAWHAGPSTDEVSLSLLLDPAAPAAGGPWSVTWLAGASLPGGLLGSDLRLSRAPAWSLGIGRRLGRDRVRLGLALGAAAHESRDRTLYGEVPGNQRGLEIWELALTGEAPLGCRLGLCWEAGAAARLARWEGGRGLLRDGGEPVAAGDEVGAALSLAAARPVADGLWLVGRVEQVYWPRTGLGELRILGGVRTGGDTAPASRRRPRRGAARPPMPQRIAGDLAALLAVPTRLDARGWRRAGLALGAVGAAALLDGEIRAVVQRHRSPAADRAAGRLRILANQAGALAVVGAIWLGGIAAGDPAAVAAGEDAFEATVISGLLLVPALKAAVGRARPPEGFGQAAVRPLSGRESFPSGEAAEAFAIASAVAAHARSRWVRGLAWGLAGMVALARIELDRHWTSDVVAGALIGAGVGSWVAERRRSGPPPRERATAVEVTPVPGGIAVTGSARW